MASGIGIANLPNQVITLEILEDVPFIDTTLFSEAPYCRQKGRSLHHHGGRSVFQTDTK
jgi:hypothetical protein